MKIRKTGIVLLSIEAMVLFGFCTGEKAKELPDSPEVRDTLAVEKEVKLTPEMIIIKKNLKYDSHTLADTYPYKDTTREFQWDKIKRGLFVVDSIRALPASWAILQNYKNKNGESPLVKNYRRNEYTRIADTLGVERWQSVALYLTDDTITPERYGNDGMLVQLMKDGDRFAEISTVFFPGNWMVVKKYLHMISDTISFDKAVFVDRTNQNIATLEKSGEKWLVRSMNPATTGVHNPPYAQPTPLGIFVIQEKKPRMIYLKDGVAETGGFAPYASRFTNGAYLHGVPVNAPRSEMIEFSPSLGTTPRSHMCVRNATSHAKFIYDWSTIDGTIVFVFE